MYIVFFQTAFVRQKTPHPKELKAKAHKLFGNKKPIDDSRHDNGEQNGEMQDNNEPEAAMTSGLVAAAVSAGPQRAFFADTEPVIHEAPSNFAVTTNDQDDEDDDEEVRIFPFSVVFFLSFINLNVSFVSFFSLPFSKNSLFTKTHKNHN